MEENHENRNSAVLTALGPKTPNSLITYAELQFVMEVEDDIIQRLFQTQDHRLDARFIAIDRKYEGIKTEFEAIDKRFKGVEKCLELVQARLDSLEIDVGSMQRNRLAIRAHHKIYPILRRLILPRHFPKCVGHFWALRDDLNKLTSLLDFYEYKDFPNWDEFDPMVEIKGSSQLPSPQLDLLQSSISPLQAAVRRHPDEAMMSLAVILGLEYDRVAENMRKYEAYREQKFKENNKVFPPPKRTAPHEFEIFTSPPSPKPKTPVRRSRFTENFEMSLPSRAVERLFSPQPAPPGTTTTTRTEAASEDDATGFILS